MSKKDSLITQNNIIKCLIIVPILKKNSDEKLNLAKLEEAEGLAYTLSLQVVDKLIVLLDEYRPSTMLKAGKIEEISTIVNHNEVELVYIDAPISPVQQRNLEKAFKAKVIDRTGLILEIFASRARTNEGQLQVRLAHLDYQKSRLVRMWTHLERQRGGLGNIGGPGETQIEADRRMIKEEIVKIKKKLEKVKNTRTLNRKTRESVPYPVVSLVGYTNAGKSTLFNLLTKAKVLTEDKLFATLDPTMRIVKLPSKRTIILSDTVGFISDLPHELVAAFRATLEEVISADIIIHVKDASSPLILNHHKEVEKVIKSLGLQEKWQSDTIHVYNKIDKVESKSLVNPEMDQQNEIFKASNDIELPNNAIKISALKNIGILDLLNEIDIRLRKDEQIIEIDLSPQDGEQLAWLYAHSYVNIIEQRDTCTKLQVAISEQNLNKWRAKYGNQEV